MPSDYGQGHALLSEKNALWHSSRAPCKQHDSGMKASTCQFSQCTPLCAGLPRLHTLQFNFRKDLYWCCWKCCCNISPWGSGCFLPGLEKRYFWSSSGTVDKLISCLRLLMSLGPVNGFYNSINSTLAVLWTLCSPQTVSELLHQIIFRCYAKTAAAMWLVYNGISMLCTNKTKMIVLDWPKTTPA